MTKKIRDVQLSALPTPNPNTIKFLIGNTLFEKGTVDFDTEEKAQGSVLPEALYDIDGVCSVMIGFNFVSVTKEDDIAWDDVLEEARDTIIDIIETEEDVIKTELRDQATLSVVGASDVDKKIIKILDEEIRPAIAMDGGDVEYKGFENGVVSLQLQGACSSCPAATMTLKMGIENRLKEEIPEVQEVIQV